MKEVSIGNLEFYNEVEIGDLGHDVKIINTGGGLSSDYNDLDNKPKINDVELSGNKSLSDLGIDQDFVKDTNYVHTDNNYTDEDRKKLGELNNYDDTALKELISKKANPSDIPTKLSELENDKNFIDNTYHDSSKQNSINDLETIRAGASKGATALQSISKEDVTDALGYTPYNSSNPDGYTSNTGTYSKPTDGIPKSDLESSVQSSLDKADSSIQKIKTINNQSLEGEGNIEIQGGSSAEVDNTTITKDDNNKLQTVAIKDQNLTSRKVWVGTKAQYDAITEKDTNTIYNVTDEKDVNQFGDYIIQVKDSTDSLEDNDNIITFIV